MDPEFQRILLRVVLIGGTVGVIGVGALILAFRSVLRDGDKPGDLRPAVLIGVVIVFVLLACAVLFLISLTRN